MPERLTAPGADPRSAPGLEFPVALVRRRRILH